MSRDPKFSVPEHGTATHCLRLDRHRAHDERLSSTWGVRYLYCDGAPVVEGGAEQAEWCEDCATRLLPNTRAVTCWVHRLCVSCDPHRTDRCSECDYYAGRWSA